MQYTTITLTSSITGKNYEKSNEMMGQLKDALVSAGIISVVSDNNPSTDEQRLVVCTVFGGQRQWRFRSVYNTANTAQVVVEYYEGTSWVNPREIIYTNLTSFSYRLFTDSKTFALTADANFMYGGFCGYKAVSGKPVIVYDYGIKCVLDSTVTTPWGTFQYGYFPSYNKLYLTVNQDSVFTLCPGIWSSTSYDNSGRWMAHEDATPDRNVWFGQDKFSGTIRQAVEVSSGNYLYIPYSGVYLGYMSE